MLLLPVAFCTPMHKHECDLNIEWDEGANVIMCYICDQGCSYSYLLKILVTGVTGFLYKRSSGPYGEFQPIPICKFALFT